MSGRRVALPAPTTPVPAEDPLDTTRATRATCATWGDLSGLRADLLRSRGTSSQARWPEDGPTWQQEAPEGEQDATAWQPQTTALWVEDPVSSPGAPGPVWSDALHPDDLAVLHDLPDTGLEHVPEHGPEPVRPPAPRTERRQTFRGSADGLSLWSDPEEDAPDREPAPRRREDRARAPWWAVVLAAVLALLVGATLTALATEGQVRSARQETAEAVSAAQDARESADQARIALQESETLTELTAPEPRDPQPFDEGFLEDGTEEDGEAPVAPAPRSTRSVQEPPRGSAPAVGSSGDGAPDAPAADTQSGQRSRTGQSAPGSAATSESGAEPDDPGCTSDPGAGSGAATGGDGGGGGSDACP